MLTEDDSKPPSAHRALTVILLACVVVLGLVVAYQQIEIAGLNSSLADIQQGKSAGICGINIVTSSYDFSPESSHVVSSSGLELNLTVNSGSIRCGDTVYASAFLFNTLDSNLTLALNSSALSSLANWGYRGAFPCGSDLPLQLAVFAGYYGGSNFSRAGDPLQLEDSSVVVLCTTQVPPPSGLVFLPRSGTAYRVSQYPPLSGQLVAVNVSLMHWACGRDGSQGWLCGDEMGASGAYSSVGIGSNNGFHVFQYGEYTIAAMDAWGDIALAHFVVQ